MRPRLFVLTLCVAGMATLAVGAVPFVTTAASASVTPATSSRTLPPGTRFYIPLPAAGSLQQITQLALHGDLKDARLLAMMEATPQAVWFNGTTQSGAQQTPAQVQSQVAQAMFGAFLEHAVPVLVVYNIPGRDCSQYSAGGAVSDTAYEAWITGFAKGIGSGKAVVLLEPDGLANMPTDCGAAYRSSQPSRHQRHEDCRHQLCCQRPRG